MRLFFKWVFSLLIIAVTALGLWLYYPVYQIQQMKEEAVPSSAQASLSYVEYFSRVDQERLTHLAIGDSIVTGIGSEEQESFVNYFSRQLEEKTGKSVVLQNQGIPGIASTDLNRLTQSGEFDTHIKEADLITISVGGNDILQALALNEGDYRNIVQDFHSMQATFIDNLTSMADRIREVNPQATIVFLEMYNPLDKGHEYYSLADQLLPKWNVKIYEAARKYDHSIVLETTKVINSNHQQYLSADGVHPNALGYQALSDQMLKQLQQKVFVEVESA